MLTPAIASAADTFMRLGVAVEGPRRQMQFAEDVMDSVLAGSDLQDPVHPAGIRRAARRMRVRMLNPTAVHKIGRSLHVTHIVVVRILSHENSHKRQLFADMTLHDIINEAVLYHQQYYLPDGKLTESTAGFILDRVRSVVQGNARKDDEAQAPSAPAAAQMHSHDIDTETKAQKHQNDSNESDNDSTFVTTGEETQDNKASVFVGVSHYSVGPMLGMRRATMTSQGKPIALCYCNKGGFGAAMPGVDARFSLFFDPNSTNFGFDVQGFAEYASTTVLGDANINTTVHNIFWRLEGMAAYRFNLPADTTLRVQLGFAYARYPLAEGAFPGLAYGAPQLGLQFTAPLVTDWLTLEAGGAFMAPVFPGSEAATLGKAAFGLGGRAGGALRLSLGPAEVSAGVAWDIVSVSFSGTTTLYSATNFASVALTDQHLDVFLRAGSHF